MKEQTINEMKENDGNKYQKTKWKKKKIWNIKKNNRGRIEKKKKKMEIRRKNKKEKTKLKTNWIKQTQKQRKFIK